MDIFLRVAVPTGNMPNNFTTKACDCRMLYILSGKGKITIEGKSFVLKENTFCYYPPGVDYFPSSSKTEPLYFITINLDLNRNYSHLKGVRRTVKSEEFNKDEALYTHLDCDLPIFRQSFVLQEAGRYRELFETVAKDFKNGKGNEAAASALLQYICYKIAENPNGEKEPNTLYERALDYIEKHYSTITGNREIAEALNYHDYYLNRIFKANAGMPLHRYIINLRLEKAATLLGEGKLSVQEVAKSVGFYNSDHFSKRFCDKYGMSPSQYKKQESTLLLV